MKQLFGAIILSALIVTGCAKDSNPTDRVLELDSWWSLDYAKQSCQQATQWLQQNRDLISQLGCDAVTSCKELMPRVNACTNDPGREVFQFFAQLAAQLASNTQCEGVQVTKYDGPNSATSSAAANTMTKPHSTLIVDYAPGVPKQFWTLLQGDNQMDGEGDPKEIAASICTIVAERGARIVK